MSLPAPLKLGIPSDDDRGVKSFSGEEDEHLLRLFFWDRKSSHVRPLNQGLKGMLGMKLLPYAVKKASEAGGYSIRSNRIRCCTIFRS